MVANRVMVETEKQFEEMLDFISKKQVFAFDTETTGLNPHTAKLFSVSIYAPSKAFQIPVYDKGNWPIYRLRELFGTNKTKVAHNASFDIKFLSSVGIEVAGPIMDSFTLVHAVDENAAVTSMGGKSWKSGLKDLVKMFLDMDEIGVTMRHFPKEWEGAGIITADPEELKDYATDDVIGTYWLAKKFYSEARQFREVTDLEHATAPVVAAMELLGVGFDSKYFEKELVEKEAEYAQLLKDIHSIGGEFNLNSPQQVATVLFDNVGLKPIRKTGTGGRSTDAKTLAVLKDTDTTGIVEKILLYRKVSKIITTYLRPLLKLDLGGRIYGSFDPLGTVTGRFSSSDPNLQNIPRGELRQAFVAREGHLLVCADYSQVELRLLAHLADDQTMKKAFQKGKDIHLTTAEEIFGKDRAADMRTHAKSINFGIGYGLSPNGLVDDLKSKGVDISKEDASKYIRKYFSRYPSVRRFIRRTHKSLRKNGYVETMIGRRRRPAGYASDDFGTQGYAQREAVNFIIQGSAADVVKMAMVALYEQGLTPILTVHDELVFEVPKKDAEKVAKLVKEVMEGVIELSVPVIVDVGIGKNWYEAK